MIVDRARERVIIDFDAEQVATAYHAWRDDALRRLEEPFRDNPPYWSFERVTTTAKKKLDSVLYALAAARGGRAYEEFHYERAWLLEGFILDRFLGAIEDGLVKIDFDARTGHNHGTKFRIKAVDFPDLYQDRIQVL